VIRNRKQNKKSRASARLLQTQIPMSDQRVTTTVVPTETRW
jgi:hypothetical protein